MGRAGKRRRPFDVADKLHVAQIGAVDDRHAAAPPGAIHAVAADHRRAVQRGGFLGRMRIVADFRCICLHPRQPPDADDLGLERIFDVERPDHPLVPARRIVGHECEPALEIDPEAMRAGAGHVVEADRLRRRRLRNIENEKAGARILAFVAGEPLRVHVEQIVADDAQLMAMHAGRRAEFADLVRLSRIAHVVHGKAFRAVEARAADRADISVALVHLHQAAAAPGGRSVVAEAGESFWLLRGRWRAFGRSVASKLFSLSSSAQADDPVITRRSR